MPDESQGYNWDDFKREQGELQRTVSQPCPECQGPGQEMGILGNLQYFRCRNCGAEYNVPLEQENVNEANDDADPAENGSAFIEGAWPNNVSEDS